jgi:hypothetical protein
MTEVANKTVNFVLTTSKFMRFTETLHEAPGCCWRWISPTARHAEGAMTEVANRTVGFTLTTSEFMRFTETLETILSTQSIDDIGLVNIQINYVDGAPERLEVWVTKYDENALADTEWLAKYEVDGLAMNDDLAPLQVTLRPR